MGRNNDVTGTYSSGAAARTATYQTESDKTYAYVDLQETGFKSKTHHLGVGDNVRLRGEDYAITGIISEGTGEAVIYRIADKNLRSFALKLYFEFSNPKEEPNGETLRRIRQIIDPDILRLHDFGVGADKYEGKYCFEISDFAEGGDLFSVSDLKAHYTPAHIEKTIIPEIFKGIKKLHSYKIYHCDLKPWNIFYLDAQRTDIVIGDYGSGKAFDLETEKDARKTSTLKGTEAYLSPEQSRGIISEKNDYYSFGIILLHLLYPDSIAFDSDFRRTDKEKFELIVERQYNSMPIIEFDARYGRLNTLIAGLTLLNHHNRWGSFEVEKWLKGDDVEVRYRGDGFETVQPIKLGYATIKTSQDFVKVLDSNPSGYEDLIEDPDTYATVKAWLDSYRDIPTRKTFDSMVRFYQPFGREYVKEAAIRFFEPHRPIAIDMQVFDLFKSADLQKTVEGFIARIDEIWKITALENLRFYLFQLEICLRQIHSSQNGQIAIVSGAIVEKIYSAFGVAQTPFQNLATQIPANLNPKKQAESFRQLLNLFYVFNPERGFRDSRNQSIKTAEDLALYFAKNEQTFADKFVSAERTRFVEQIKRSELAKLQYAPFLFEVFRSHATTSLELESLTFDKTRKFQVRYRSQRHSTRFSRREQ
jgi:serine/threonine protein kinase